jgi:prolyl-tRNA synthetase
MSKKNSKAHGNDKDSKGITVTKEQDFSEWYSQLVLKGDLADHSLVSGCLVYKPRVMAIWEKIRDVVDSKLKEMGVQNVYFPLLIPESLLIKEQEHVEGFAPEVAWVTQTGNSKLSERLAIRPTSETIMYDSYAKWIRSYNDLPLRLNQWNNVLRWEFKHPTPFLRSREFLWNEGHTCFATKQEAEQEIKDIINMYESVLVDYLALPSLIGKKSEKEKFAGAEYTVSTEQLMPNGKAIQGPDAHFDGQNFAKAFGIKFIDNDQKEKYVWQNTFAISTRMIGIMIAVHSDNKGLVLPPKLSPMQIVIVPILFDDSKEKVLKLAENLKKKLVTKGLSVHLDDRADYTPGWKFNEWEMKGVPVRIEIGPRDLKNKQVTVMQRDTGEKKTVPITWVDSGISSLLDEIQNNLYQKADNFLKSNIITVKSLNEAVKEIKSGKLIFAQWCNTTECEENFKQKTGAKSLNSPFEQSKVDGKCFCCTKKAKVWFYFGKSY